MKRILIVLLALLMLFASVSCDNQEAIDKAVKEATQALEEQAEKEKEEAVNKAKEEAEKEKEEAVNKAKEEAEKEKEEAVNKAKEEAEKEKDASYQNYVDFAESYKAKNDIYNFVYNLVAYNWENFDSSTGNGVTRDSTAVTDEGVISKTFSESDLNSVKKYVGGYSQEKMKDIMIDIYNGECNQKLGAITEYISVSGKVEGTSKGPYYDGSALYYHDYDITVENLIIKFKYKLIQDGKMVKDDKGNIKIFDGEIRIDGNIKQTCSGTTYGTQFTVKSVNSTTSSLSLQNKEFKNISADYDTYYSKFTTAKVNGVDIDLTYLGGIQLY